MSDPATARLAFHRHGIADLADSAAMWGDAQTTRHIGGQPSTPEESWARLLRNAGHWALTGYGFWVARERGTGRFMGEIGFKQFRRDLDPALEMLPEIGWVLAPWAWGRGLATEAARAVLGWADTVPCWPQTLCMIDPDNHASRRVAAKVGYDVFGEAAYRDKPILLLRRARGATGH